MKPGHDLDPGLLLKAIADARGRAGSVETPARLELERRYDESYWRDTSAEWMPRVAEIDALLTGGVPWLEIEIVLASGPQELYRYFPFASYIYIDGKASAIVEFTAPHQERRAVVAAPVGKRFTLSVVSELCSPPGAAEQRELAVLLREIRIGKEAPAPHIERMSSELDALTQRASPLVEKLPRPIFVVGAYRSGTSILTWALGQHPNIWPIDETRWLQLFGSGALAAYNLATSAAAQYFATYDVSRSEYMAYLGSTIDQFMSKTSERRAEAVSLTRLAGLDLEHDSRFQLRRSAMTPKQRWIDGTPENADCILLLHELFPAARFICVLRDPRDVIASMLHFHRAGGLPMDVETAASMWIQRIQSCLLAYRALGPHVVRVILYDELAVPARALRELFRFLDEPDFPTAAETFGERINSSRLADDERQEAYAEIEHTKGVTREASALFDLFRALAAEPWEYDPAVHDELRAIQNDIVTRIVQTIL